MPGPLPKSTLIPALGNRLVVCTYDARFRATAERVRNTVENRGVGRRVVEVQTHTQRPRVTNLVTQLQGALKRIRTRTRHLINRTARVEPLTRQAVAVQRKHTVEKGVPLLDPQQAPLAINQRQFIVQTRMRRRRRRNESNKSHEQSADRQHTAAGPARYLAQQLHSVPISPLMANMRISLATDRRTISAR
ncbi:Uncharacterised protein [Mycobacteroides abscessus]|nr:Uncharacterised protein [Mycobacteroides abscessus]